MRCSPFFIILTLLFLGACAPSRISPQAMSEENAMTRVQGETPVLRETPFPPETSGATQPAEPPAISKWQKYIHSATGVSFDYPANWSARVENDPGSYRITFSDPDHPFGFSVEVSISWVSPENAQSMIGKPPSVPGEGGYALVWNKPLSTPLPGWEYIVGPYPEGVDTPAPGDYAAQYLNVLYVDQQRGCTIEFHADFDYESFMQARKEGFEESVSERFAYFEHMAGSVTINPISPNSTPFLPTLTPAATGTPAQVGGSNCLIDPDQLSLLGPDGWMVQPSSQKGFCQATMKFPLLGYRLSYPDDWVITLQADFVGERGQILWFRPRSSPNIRILVWGQLTALPLKSADAALEDNEVLQENSIQILGDKQALVTVTTHDDQTVERFFIRYDSADKEPRARLFVFEVALPTAQFGLPESRNLIIKVEAMIASFVYLA